MHQVRDGWAIIIGMVYGVQVALYLNPIVNEGYRTWLLSSPWDPASGKLPFGSMFLSWQNLLMVGVLTVMAMGGGLPCWYVVAGFGICWLICSAVNMWDSDVRIHAYIIIATLALVPVALARNPLSLLPVLGLLPVVFDGNRRALKNLSNSTSSFAGNKISFLSTNKLGWPYDSLYPLPSQIVLSLVDKLCISLIAGLVSFSLAYLSAIWVGPNNELHGLVCMVSLFIVSSRLAVYLKGTAPPISFWARVTCRKLIIPKYDVIFVVPILCGVIVVGTTVAMNRTTLPATFAGAIIMSSVSFLCLAGYPSWMQWRLLGNVRHKFTRDAAKKFINLGSGQVANKSLASTLLSKK